jgi:quercetin dioxygenase-like cupin family protein
MIDFDNLLAGEISRQRPDRIVKAFNEGYVVVSSDETNGAVCVMTAIGMPGDGAPPHTHTREDETFIIHEGVLEIHQDDQTITCHPGDVMFLERGRRHYFKVISGNPAKYTVVCTPGGFDRFFRESAEEFKKPKPDFQTLVDIGAKYGIQIEGPPAP